MRGRIVSRTSRGRRSLNEGGKGCGFLYRGRRPIRCDRTRDVLARLFRPPLYRRSTDRPRLFWHVPGTPSRGGGTRPQSIRLHQQPRRRRSASRAHRPQRSATAAGWGRISRTHLLHGGHARSRDLAALMLPVAGRTAALRTPGISPSQRSTMRNRFWRPRRRAIRRWRRPGME